MFTIREEIASENQFRRDALDNNIIKKETKKEKTYFVTKTSS